MDYIYHSKDTVHGKSNKDRLISKANILKDGVELN